MIPPAVVVLMPAQVLCECRAQKSKAELRILRYACQVASQAHVAVMRVRKHWGG